MPVQRSDSHFGMTRHGLETGVGPAGAEDSPCGIEQAISIAGCVGARLAFGLW